jgi:hypothetical protein
MRSILLAVLALALVAPWANGHASERPIEAVAPEMSAALVDHVASQRELARATAPVRSAAQLHRYLREHRGPTSPFHALSAGALARFTGSLRFTERGLASFDYTDLRRELSASQIHSLLRVFGVEDSATLVPSMQVRSAGDALVVQPMVMHSGHHDMYCAGQGTCHRSPGMVCTDNC